MQPTNNEKNKIYHYVNLTNGIEAIPNIDGDYRFIRIQSTLCEQKRWDQLIQELDYDFLMNLALGHKCVIYDFGAGKPIPRAVYQGVELIKYVLHRRWLNKEYATDIRRAPQHEKRSCNRYFSDCYKSLEDRTKKKLDYFKAYIDTDNINLQCISSSTEHDSDKEFYRGVLQMIAKS